MDKTRAGFNILTILMLIDGKVEQPELKIITEFVENNISEIKFDDKKELELLLEADIQELLLRFGRAGMIFNQCSQIHERRVLIDYALDMVRGGDGQVQIDEIKLMLILGGMFNIDVRKMLMLK